MKEIAARDQAGLGIARCLRLAVAGMRYRLFRSFVTIAILALAVAFLVHTLSFSILTRSIREAARAELAESRRLGEIITRIAAPDGEAEVQRALALGPPERVEEYRRFAGSHPEFERALATARALDRLGRFVEGLPVPVRAALAGDSTPRQLWSELAVPENLSRFAEQLSSFHLRLPDMTDADLADLVGPRRAALEDVLAAIVRGHERAISVLVARHPGRTPADLASAPPPDFARSLEASGFRVLPADVARLAAFSSGLEARARLERALLDTDVRAGMARELGVDLSEVSLDAVVRGIDDAGGVAVLSSLLERAGVSLGLDPAALLGLLTAWDRERLLTSALGAGAESDGGLDTRTRWLISLSFIVCVVGVANAMLMSVTERFTEIATMKCLGALDGSVMLMFVFEAVLQGVAGGFVGVLLGVVLALARGAAEFGQLLGAALGSSGQIALAGGAAFSAGILLAGIAAVGPALVASRLAPMEAMRVE